MEFGRWLTMNEPRWSLACSYPNPHPSSLNLNSPHLVEHHYLSPNHSTLIHLSRFSDSSTRSTYHKRSTHRLRTCRIRHIRAESQNESFHSSTCNIPLVQYRFQFSHSVLLAIRIVAMLLTDLNRLSGDASSSSANEHARSGSTRPESAV
jgi:hypothetical protein